MHGLGERLAVWPSAQYKYWSVTEYLPLYIKNNNNKIIISWSSQEVIYYSCRRKTVNFYFPFCQICHRMQHTHAIKCCIIFSSVPEPFPYFICGILFLIVRCLHVFISTVSDNCFYGILLSFSNSFLLNDCQLIFRLFSHSGERDCAAISPIVSAHMCAYKFPAGLENYKLLTYPLTVWQHILE